MTEVVPTQADRDTADALEDRISRGEKWDTAGAFAHHAAAAVAERDAVIAELSILLEEYVSLVGNTGYSVDREGAQMLWQKARLALKKMKVQS